MYNVSLGTPHITRITTIKTPTTNINAIWANHTFFKSLKIIRNPKSIRDKITHSAISHPHENVISVSKFISEIAQTSKQANVIFKGVSFTIYFFLNLVAFPLGPVFPFNGFFARELTFGACFFS